MALVATVGGATSNSYGTRAEANAYFQLGMHPKSLTWFNLADEAKDEYLVLATAQIDALPIKGAKYDTAMTSGVPDQRLKFPRGADYDDSTSYIPAAVKQATYEQSVWLAQGGGGSSRELLQAQGVKSVTIGDVSESYGDSTFRNPFSQLSPMAKNILMASGVLRKGGRWAA
jgi:hypothetical protein